MSAYSLTVANSGDVDVGAHGAVSSVPLLASSSFEVVAGVTLVAATGSISGEDPGTAEELLAVPGDAVVGADDLTLEYGYLIQPPPVGVICSGGVITTPSGAIIVGRVYRPVIGGAYRDKFVPEYLQQYNEAEGQWKIALIYEFNAISQAWQPVPRADYNDSTGEWEVTPS
jgi:hypothetical protein